MIGGFVNTFFEKFEIFNKKSKYEGRDLQIILLFKALINYKNIELKNYVSLITLLIILLYSIVNFT